MSTTIKTRTFTLSFFVCGMIASTGCDRDDSNAQGDLAVGQLEDTNATLVQGEKLLPGQALVSDNGQFRLAFTQSGRLELFNGEEVVWRSPERVDDSQIPQSLDMQFDGNLVLYAKDEVPMWDSQTHNQGDGQIEGRLSDEGVFSVTRNGETVWSTPAPRQIARKRYRIDRKKFYDSFRRAFGRLSQSQVDGLNFLLKNTEFDSNAAVALRNVWLRQMAYVYATVKHEVANTYKPIVEYGNKHCRRYDGGCRYKGRGYVQLTHRYNYKKMSKIVGRDLVAEPNLALDPDVAYHVLSYGMHYGSFTGKKLGSYIRKGKTDYYNARRVVNGTDKASLIRGYARTFQGIFEKSVK